MEKRALSGKNEQMSCKISETHLLVCLLDIGPPFLQILEEVIAYPAEKSRYCVFKVAAEQVDVFSLFFMCILHFFIDSVKGLGRRNLQFVPAAATDGALVSTAESHPEGGDVTCLKGEVSSISVTEQKQCQQVPGKSPLHHSRLAAMKVICKLL